MTAEDIEKLYDELVKHYGDKLANFEHEPRRFAYQIKMYQYYKDKV